MRITGDEASAIARAILELTTSVPASREQRAIDPATRAQAIAAHASIKAGVLSGTLALPAGPAGMLTVLPDLVGVWRVQAQMVADIAGVFGKTAGLTREHTLYCLFKHAAAQAARDLIVRVGERVMVRQLAQRTLRAIADKLGVAVTKRLFCKSAARWLPAVGSVGVAAYAYYDTRQVAATAIELFRRELEPEPTQVAADSVS